MAGYNFHTMPLDEHIKSLNFQDQNVITFIASNQDKKQIRGSFDQDEAPISRNFVK